jgi:hypothetical protein
MAIGLSRGPQDEPLPADTIVLRASKLPPDYQAERPLSREAFNFQLSTSDKLQPVPKLSVYVHVLTTEAQACALVGDGTTHRLIVRLSVSAIRAIDVEGHCLDALWDEAIRDDGTPDTRPGAEGHAGIAGLHRPPQAPKTVFKTLQVRLADAVGQNYTVIDLPDVPAGAPFVAAD